MPDLKPLSLVKLDHGFVVVAVIPMIGLKALELVALDRLESREFEDLAHSELTHHHFLRLVVDEVRNRLSLTVFHT